MSRRRSRSTARRLVIIIEARKKSDGSDVSTKVEGKVAKGIFQKGDEDWTYLKGAVHLAISAIGLSGHGRDVTIRTEP